MKYNINYTEIRGFCKERYLRRYRENVGFRKINWSFLQAKENPLNRDQPTSTAKIKSFSVLFIFSFS
jgi:hypothetical protein